MIQLETFTEKDFERLISWIDDHQSLALFAGTIFQYPLTIPQLQDYMTEANRTVFRVKETHSETIIGHAETLRVGSKRVRLCRILIGEKQHRGKGHGSRIIKGLLEKAFAAPEVEVVELNVYSHNYPAIKCYERAGFRRNPSGNKRTLVGGEHWLSVNMVMNRNDFADKAFRDA